MCVFCVLVLCVWRILTDMLLLSACYVLYTMYYTAQMPLVPLAQVIHLNYTRESTISCSMEGTKKNKTRIVEAPSILTVSSKININSNNWINEIRIYDLSHGDNVERNINQLKNSNIYRHFMCTLFVIVNTLRHVKVLSYRRRCHQQNAAHEYWWRPSKIMRWYRYVNEAANGIDIQINIRQIVEMSANSLQCCSQKNTDSSHHHHRFICGLDIF